MLSMHLLRPRSRRLRPRRKQGRERNARLDGLLAASWEREERAQAARVETQRVRLAALRVSMASSLARGRRGT